jgi:hypothetical protein
MDIGDRGSRCFFRAKPGENRVRANATEEILTEFKRQSLSKPCQRRHSK